MFRRRPREPPSTGQLNAPRRRQPVDPPSSLPQPQSVEPEIQLTARQLEILQRKQGGAENSFLHQLDPKEEVSREQVGNEGTTYVTEHWEPFADENENKPMAQAMVAKEQPVRTGTQQHASASSNVASQETASIKSDRPFTTRSNQVNNKGVSKNLSLASRKLGKEGRSLVGRSSVFRKRTSNDKETVASVVSTKTILTASSTATKSSAQTGISDRDRDRAALRKLLGTDSSEAKPSASAPKAKTAHTHASQPTEPSRPIKEEVQAPVTASRPTKINIPEPMTAVVDDQFDQKEYVRNLLSSRAQKSSAPPKKVPSTNGTAPAKQSTLPPEDKDAVPKNNSAKSNTTGSSSASYDQSAILRKVLSRTMAKNKPKEKPTKRLSPKSKGSKSPKFDHGRMENAAVSLSRKVLAEKSSSPKGQPKGLKGYVRSKMGLSRKSSRAKSEYDPTLSNSASSDSADLAPSQCISQMASLSSDAGDDDKTRTTTTSSSNMSETTHHSHENSLKQLSTAETIDTDESSTIMGNLQSASSDSMQYSSEEGCEDTSVIDKSAFRAIDQLSLGGTKNHATSMISHSRGGQQKSNGGQLVIKHQNQGYNDFLEALQAEASGAHSQLWSSFQAVMTGSPRRPPFQQETVSSFRFDTRTREMLAVMNAHLKRHATVECVTSTQLVNDKKFAKEVAVGLTPRPSYSSYKVGSRPGKLSITQDCNDGDDNRISSCKSVNQAVDISNAGSTTGVGLQQPIWKNGDIQFCRPNQSKSRSSTESHHTTESAIKPEGRRGASLSSIPSLNRNKVTGAQAVSSEVTTVAFSRPRLSLESKHMPQIASKTEEGGVPWSGVRLRAVSNSCATVTSSQDDSKNQPKQGSIPSPWLKVKLRRVPDAVECEQAEHEQMKENDSMAFELSPRNLESTKSSHGTSELKAVEDNSSNVDGDVPVKSCGSSIHKNPGSSTRKNVVETAPSPDAPKNSLPMDSLDDSSITFALKRTGSASNEDQVVISKKMVMLIQSSPGKPKATPTWSLAKDKIKALTLDMESLRVSLSLVESDESKVLSFKDSADCLNFANAFYEMLQPNQHPEHTKSSNVMEDGQDAHIVESLSHEEQQVLETYRQARRTKPAVDAMKTAVPNAGSTSDNDTTGATVQKAGGALQGPAFLNDILKRRAGNDVSESVVSSVSCSETKSEKQLSKLPLSEKDMEVAESYQKMLKLKIPPEAVQHKMTKESVDPKIIAFVLGQAGVLAPDTSYPDDFTQTERQITMLYRSMLKLTVPPDDVRKQMQDDNIDEKIVFAVMGREKEQLNSATKLSETEEAIAGPYRKMLKMMIPKDAVRHKMMKEQVDPKIIVAVVGGEHSSDVGEPRLSPEEEKIASSYRKMLKLSLPPEAVRHKMEKEGVDPKIVKAVLGASADTKSASLKNGTSKCAKSKLVSLHWTPLSGKELHNSVWSATTKRKSQPAGSDISKLVELFQKKSTVKVMKGSASDGNNDTGSGKAKLLDLNRANIIAISLKAFKDFTYDELASILQNVDPLRRLRGERVQFVKDLLPTAAETTSIKRYFGSPDRLVPAEKWFQKIVHIKRLEAKAHVLHTMEVFDTEVAEIKKSLHLLTRVCTQVMESERLRELLDMVLQIGNIMNEGTRTGGASGFKFDSLLRLTQTKSGDGKTTVLDYMVTIYAAKGQKQTLNLVEDFPECQVASRVLISDLITNVNEVNEKMLKCRQEYESLVSETKIRNRSTGDERPVGAENGAGSDTSPQLSTEINVKGTPEKEDNISSEGVSYTPREKTKIRAKETAKAKNNDIHAGIARLNDFLTNAEDTYRVLKQECDFAVETCREMSKYCGEGGGERSTDTLLGILCEFASSLDAAVKKHERAMEAEAKKAAKQASAPKKTQKKPEGVHSGSGQANSLGKQQKTGPGPRSGASSLEEKKKTQTAAAGPQTQGKGTSLVLMVNQLLKDASDETKRDFSQGVVYENPDQKLKAIYEREKRTASSVNASPSRRAVAGDIISAINRRQSEDGAAAAKAKRTQLERVIDCINCATGAADSTIEEDSAVGTESGSTSLIESDHPADRFQDLHSQWTQLKKRDSESSFVSKRKPSMDSTRSNPTPGQDDGDEGSVHQPIDCTSVAKSS